MILALSLLSLSANSFAYSSGKTGNSTTGCGGCHNAAATTTASFSASETTVAPGDTITVEFTVESTAGTAVGAGLDVSTTGGTLAAGSDNQLSASEITHTGIETLVGGSYTFTFSWTAPSTVGSYSLRGSGNAVNRDGRSSSDGYDIATDLTLTVEDPCNDIDADGVTDCDGDCDDGDANISPAESELCDGIDNNCDDLVDDATAVDAGDWYPDDDGDGFGADAGVESACTQPDGYTDVDGDCDDTDDQVSPDGVESCNGVDDNCDGSTDGIDAIDAISFSLDLDLDGYGDPAEIVLACEEGPGAVSDSSDCDDGDADVNPGAAEVCDAADVDEDCDGLSDDSDSSVGGTSTYYMDGDADGFGDATMTTAACSTPSGYSALSTDCNDSDAAYNPGASEADCTDPNDYNCDGAVGVSDGDGDGYSACEDCNDGNAAAYPGASETCNGGDDNCDGVVDESTAVDAANWYVDADGDGFGSLDAQKACTQPDGTSADSTDCDDANAAVSPGEIEIWYDGVDQTCDGNDADQDGDGVVSPDDCLDTDASVFPEAEDAWYDGVDSDCAGNSDYDADADGYDSETYGGDDCDDANDITYPGAPDTPYDGIVNDCDESDELDADGDGSDAEAAGGSDCDDANSEINPAATEVWYDGVDQNCDDNDDDQDGDGVAVDTDCDDTDSGITVCDSGGGDSEPTSGDDAADDTGTEKDEGGCGCASAGDSSWLGLLPLLLVGLSTRRRRN